MGKPLDQAHVAPQRVLNRCDGEQSGVELSELLAGVTHHVVEIHARQSPMPTADVAFNLPNPHGAQMFAGVMEHVLATAVGACHQVTALLDTIDDAVLGHSIQRAADPNPQCFAPPSFSNKPEAGMEHLSDEHVKLLERFPPLAGWTPDRYRNLQRDGYRQVYRAEGVVLYQRR